MKRSLALLVAALLAAGPVLAGEGDEESVRWDDEVNVTREIQEAVEAGHAYLVSMQEENSGAFDAESEYRIAITAFACLSLMAGGHVPGRGKYGDHVASGLRFLLGTQSEQGYFKRRDDKSRMHGHGYALLALIQAYGMTEGEAFREKMRESIRKGIDHAEKAQRPEGGWGYEPGDAIHEGSVTVVQLQALRAARGAGFTVAIEVVEKAKEYLRLSAKEDGSFRYRLDHAGAHTSFPLTAAGVASLQARGDYAAKELDRGLEFLIEYKYPHRKDDQYYESFFYYGQFYAAQAFYQAPDRHFWKEWYPAMVEQLLSREYYFSYGTPHWRNSRYGEVYATAIATLVLQIPYKYLPIFQR